MKIKEAYDVLSNQNTRARYDAGLALEASIGFNISKHQRDTVYREYRPPLRCGWVLATGTENIGRFVVSEILGWEDITNASGQVLVTSWDTAAQTYKEEWVAT